MDILSRTQATPRGGWVGLDTEAKVETHTARQALSPGPRWPQPLTPIGLGRLGGCGAPRLHPGPSHASESEPSPSLETVHAVGWDRLWLPINHGEQGRGKPWHTAQNQPVWAAKDPVKPMHLPRQSKQDGPAWERWDHAHADGVRRTVPGTPLPSFSSNPVTRQGETDDPLSISRMSSTVTS